MNGVRFKNRRINIWNSATIGIEVADGVKVVDFNDAEPNVELRSVKKQFPSVETLIIGKSTSTLEISNFMFPNVKEVISENNQDFKSGNVLIKHGYDGFKLLNTFCKQTDEVIDLQDVISVSNYAFEGCLSKNIINFKLQYAEQYAFHGYPYMSSVEYVNGANCVGDICLSIDEDADVVEIPKNVTMVVISEDFSGSIKIKCNKLIINSAKSLESCSYVTGLSSEKPYAVRAAALRAAALFFLFSSFYFSEFPESPEPVASAAFSSSSRLTIALLPVTFGSFPSHFSIF